VRDVAALAASMAYRNFVRSWSRDPGRGAAVSYHATVRRSALAHGERRHTLCYNAIDCALLRVLSLSGQTYNRNFLRGSADVCALVINVGADLTGSLVQMVQAATLAICSFIAAFLE
jgi:hypothetical protein